MEAPTVLSNKKIVKYSKTTSENEKYSLILKIKDNNLIFISIIFENITPNQIYEGEKLYEEIKIQSNYFKDNSIEEIFNKISELISKDNIEIIKNEEQILYNIILPLEKMQTLNFILENQNINNSLFQKIIKQKDDIIKQKDDLIKQKEEIIKEKEDIIKQKDEFIKETLKQKDEFIKETLKQKDDLIKQKDEIIEEKNNIIKELKEKKLNKKEKEENNKNDNKEEENKIELDYNQIFENFNIENLTPKNKLTNHGKNPIYTILQLKDGRLASGGNDGAINIYNKQTFKPDLTINEHSSNVYHLIQLKNGNLVSCSNSDHTINLYELIENNNYKLLYSINVGNDNYPYKIREIENGEIGLVAYNSIIFYLNINDELNEDFNIKQNKDQIGYYRNMIAVKPGELVICGNENKIQFFDLNSRKLKEIININRNIHYRKQDLLCMINDKCLCVGGQDKISLIDVYQKNIIREIEDKGVHNCLFKLNDNILLSGKDNGDITQWKISQTNLTLVHKKEKSHESCINQMIHFDKLIISCSDDYSIKIW